MRKIFLIYTGLIFLCFFLPALLTNKTEKTSMIIEDSVKEEHSIKLLHTKTGDIEEMDLEEYLYGVVSAEMPASFEIEALKAQAIVARTYTIFKEDKGKHGEASICDDSNCCQAWISKEERLAKWDENKRNEYWNKIVSAIDSTRGLIITYNDEPINAFFHSNSGGTTEAPIDVWGGNEYPYLQTVATAGEDAYSQYSSEVVLTKEEVLEKIKKEHPEAQIDFESNNWVQVKDYTEGGRVRTIQIGNVTISGVEVRKTFGLKSANFKISKDGENVKFNVIGYGHGVGMSQTGADSLAKKGKMAEEIIHHFYSDVEIVNMYKKNNNGNN